MRKGNEMKSYIEIYSEDEDEEDFEFPCYWGCPIDKDEEEVDNDWYFPTEDNYDDFIGWD